ncbi:MAG: hypothetical protein ACJ76A_00140 [Actinomycetota bacterium]
MKTLTRPPQTPVRPRAVAEAPRRWPRRLATIAAVAVLVALATTTVWLANIDPLATGETTYPIAGRGLDVTRRTIDAFGATGTVQSVQMRRDMTFRYRFSITNTGPLPITILDVGSQAPRGISSTVVAAKPSLATPAGSKGFGPFAPFSVGAGQTAGLTMQVHVAQDVCYPAGSDAAWYTEPVTYRVLGITRHAEVPMGTEIRLEGTDATGC